MKKVFKQYALSWAVSFILFNVICFVTPNKVAEYNKFDATFWTSYIFIIAAFIGHLACAYYAFNTNDKTKFFYNIPIIRIGYSGLVLTLIFGVLCMAIPNLPNWIRIIVCFIVFVFMLFSIIKAEAASDVVSDIDTKVKTQTQFIKSITVDAENLISSATTPENRKYCKDVYEAFRYSDPMSNDIFVDVESKISSKFNEFSNAVKNNDECIKTITDELLMLINERNKKCKLLK